MLSREEPRAKYSYSEVKNTRVSGPDAAIRGTHLPAPAPRYAAVWAHENTRESIFDAMKRKEAYATTGPRMTVRFFGGWDFQLGDAKTRRPAVVGYEKGVPMGGDLRRAPQGKSPSFLLGLIIQLKSKSEKLNSSLLIAFSFSLLLFS